eukprot:gene322-33545_t
MLYPGTPTGPQHAHLVGYSAGKEYTKCTLRDYSFKWDIFMTSVPESLSARSTPEGFLQQVVCARFPPDPSPNDLSSIAFGYSSTVDPAAHQQLGLVGLVHIGRQGTFSTSDATNNAQLLLPEGVDHVVPLLWEVFNENASPLLNQSMIAAGMNPALIETFDPEVFEESNMQHGINGFMYCTMPNPTFRLGSKIRWEGSHSPFFTGQLFENNMGPDATIPLVPYQARVLDMTASQVGDWPFWCQVHDHVEAGMMAAISIVA